MDKFILKSLQESKQTMEMLCQPAFLEFIRNTSKELVNCFASKNKVLIAGNGGSLCDAMHFAEELTGFFRSRSRQAFPAIALSDPGHMSCVGNDRGFDQIFSRGVEAFGQPNDILVLLSTSGNSSNLVEAINKAFEYEMKTICFLGKDGGRLKGMADFEMVFEGFGYSDRIQEAHMAAIHIIVEMVERAFSGQSSKSLCQITEGGFD